MSVGLGTFQRRWALLAVYSRELGKKTGLVAHRNSCRGFHGVSWSLSAIVAIEASSRNPLIRRYLTIVKERSLEAGRVFRYGGEWTINSSCAGRGIGVS